VVGVAPRGVHRHAHFPVDAGDAGRGNGLFRRGEVAVLGLPLPQPVRRVVLLDIRDVIEAVVRYDRRLQLPGHRHQLVRPPEGTLVAFLGVIPPDDVERAVVAEQLAGLVVEVVQIDVVVARTVGGGPASKRVWQLTGLVVVVLRVVPVDDGVIVADLEPLGADRVSDLLAQVPSDQVAGIVGGVLRVKQTESIVVFAGDDHVAAARLLGELGPFGGETLGRTELGNRLVGVFPRVGANPLLEPLHPAARTDGLVVPRSGQAGIQAPMHKHAESRLSPPRHPGVPLFLGLGIHSRNQKRAGQCHCQRDRHGCSQGGCSSSHGALLCLSASNGQAYPRRKPERRITMPLS